MEVKIDETKGQPKEELSNVQVNLDEQNQPIIPEKPKDEPKYVRVEDLEAINKAINNTRGWNERKIGNLEAKIDQLLRGNQPAAVKSDKPTEWDEKLQKDWKGTVDEIADARVEAKLREREEQANRQAEIFRENQLRDDNKRKVLERHKELSDENSPKADIFRQVVQEHPEYLTNPFGPVLAMRDMEDRLRENGYVDDSVRPMVNKEVARQIRTNGTSIAKGNTNPSGQKTITLSKEQKEYCDTHNVKYEEYAKYATMLNNKREVSA